MRDIRRRIRKIEKTLSASGENSLIITFWKIRPDQEEARKQVDGVWIFRSHAERDSYIEELAAKNPDSLILDDESCRWMLPKEMRDSEDGRN